MCVAACVGRGLQTDYYCYYYYCFCHYDDYNYYYYNLDETQHSSPSHRRDPCV